MQMLASVSHYGFWTYYMGTGDRQTILDVLPRVKKYIHVWKRIPWDWSYLVPADGHGVTGERTRT